jgi:hypothetical protein
MPNLQYQSVPVSQKQGVARLPLPDFLFDSHRSIADVLGTESMYSASILLRRCRCAMAIDGAIGR